MNLSGARAPFFEEPSGVDLDVPELRMNHRLGQLNEHVLDEPARQDQADDAGTDPRQTSCRCAASARADCGMRAGASASPRLRRQSAVEPQRVYDDHRGRLPGRKNARQQGRADSQHEHFHAQPRRNRRLHRGIPRIGPAAAASGFRYTRSRAQATRRVQDPEQPTAPSIAPSTRNIRRIRRRLSPSAIEVPISAVRSTTLIIIVLKMLGAIIGDDDPHHADLFREQEHALTWKSASSIHSVNARPCSPKRSRKFFSVGPA